MNFTGMPPGMTPEMLAEMLGIGGQTTAQSAPRPDTNYSSGFDYARSIAGGIPASQMIAPGVSYSPDQPGGYTQQDLNAPSLPELPMQPLPQPIIEEPITGPIEPGFDGGTILAIFRDMKIQTAVTTLVALIQADYQILIF